MKLRSASTPRCVPDSRAAVDGATPSRDAGQTRILAISDYEGLRTSREQVLQLQGFHVESVTSRAVFRESWIRTFDIAVLCQSIEPADAMKIARLLRRANPNIALLRVNPCQASMERQSLFDYEMDALAGPDGLLQGIEMIGRKPGMV